MALFLPRPRAPPREIYLYERHFRRRFDCRPARCVDAPAFFASWHPIYITSESIIVRDHNFPSILSRSMRRLALSARIKPAPFLYGRVAFTTARPFAILCFLSADERGGVIYHGPGIDAASPRLHDASQPTVQTPCNLCQSISGGASNFRLPPGSFEIESSRAGSAVARLLRLLEARRV